jgi:hypothetical protein
MQTLWPGTHYTATDRDTAIKRGLEFIYRAGCVLGAAENRGTAAFKIERRRYQAARAQPPPLQRGMHLRHTTMGFSGHLGAAPRRQLVGAGRGSGAGTRASKCATLI